MSIKDVIKQSFLAKYMTGTIDINTIIVAFVITGILGVYIFICYRLLCRKSFYVRSFSVSLVATALITTAIILSMQANIIVSLGMVGALSVVRFRTAIKEPQDLVFLYWSISIGIICGVGVPQIAVILSVLVTVTLFVLDRFPIFLAPRILVINANESENEESLSAILSQFCRRYVLKSQTIAKGNTDFIFEICEKNGHATELLRQLKDKDTINSVSLVQHDGEVTF